MCGPKCAVACNRGERIMNVMAMAPSDGMSFVLDAEDRGTYHGPDKGMVKVTVVCVRK
jgi:hypothetical protein